MTPKSSKYFRFEPAKKVHVYATYVTFHEKTNHIALDVNLRYKPK